MDDAEQARTNTAEALAAAQGNSAAAKSAYEISLQSIIEGINDSKALEAEIKKAEGRITAFEQARYTWTHNNDKVPYIPH